MLCTWCEEATATHSGYDVHNGLWALCDACYVDSDVAAARAETVPATLCPSCGGSLYRSISESMATGSLRSATQFRHVETGYMACPRQNPETGTAASATSSATLGGKGPR